VPRFVQIPSYLHAKVNCSLVYVPEKLGNTLRSAIEQNYEVLNDEHLWTEILESQKIDAGLYWYNDHVNHLSKHNKIRTIKPSTRFVHLGSGDAELRHAVCERLKNP